MFLLKRPTDAVVQRTIEAQSQLPYTYGAVGATATTSPTGYVVDHNRCPLGRGAETFSQACAAVQRWSMFDFAWIELLWRNAPIVEGTTVGVLAQLPVGTALNICRIVYTIDDERDDISRFGFAYGTLPSHVERGEERFLVEWNRVEDTVWYDILAFSQPNHWLATLGYPLTRFYQRRFARASMGAMQRVVQS